MKCCNNCAMLTSCVVPGALYADLNLNAFHCYKWYPGPQKDEKPTIRLPEGVEPESDLCCGAYTCSGFAKCGGTDGHQREVCPHAVDYILSMVNITKADGSPLE